MRAPHLLAAVGLAALSACAETSERIDCPDDGACPQGLVCAFGQCVDPTDQRLSLVDIEVDPSNVSLPVQSALAVDLRTSPRVDVELRPGVVVQGLVKDAGGQAIDALVVARPARFIPGRVLAPTATATAAGGFDFLAIEDERYGLTVLPADASLPPHYDEAGFRASGDADRTQTLESLIVPTGAVVVSGRVRAGEGVGEQGIEKLDVRLIDDSGRRWSSNSRTGADGSFALALAEGLTGLTLEILPTGDNDAFPTVRVLGVDASASVDLGPISLGDVLAPVGFQARVVDAAGGPVPGARASLSARIGNGVLTRQAEADDEGVLDVRLPPGLYEAVVLGGPDEPAGGLLVVSEIDVPAANTDLVFRLPPRVSWGGLVLDADGQPLGGASLDLVRVGDEAGVPEEALADTLVGFHVIADDGGRFAASVDPGRYRVSTRPPPGARAPAFSELVTVPAEGLERNVDLPARAVVAGTAVFDGEPTGGVYVRVFSALLDEQGAAILLGEGTAGPDGAFEIVVPDLVGETPEPPGP